GLIGTWQVFDQIYVGTKGSPLNTTLTPAFLSFNSSFNSNEWGVGAAIAFILFAIIVFFTVGTRLLTRSPDRVPRRRRFGPTTRAFHELYAGQNFLLWVKNSVIVTLSVTFLRVFLDSLAGYALARLRFRGRGAAFATIVAVMAVPGVVLLIPKFLIIRQFGMYDTYYGMIVPLLVDAAGVFIMKNFFESIPVSVEESA